MFGFGNRKNDRDPSIAEMVWALQHPVAYCCPGMMHNGEHNWWCQETGIPHSSLDILGQTPKCEHVERVIDMGTAVGFETCGVKDVTLLRYTGDHMPGHCEYLCEEHARAVATETEVILPKSHGRPI